MLPSKVYRQKHMSDYHALRAAGTSYSTIVYGLEKERTISFTVAQILGCLKLACSGNYASVAMSICVLHGEDMEVVKYTQNVVTEPLVYVGINLYRNT